MSSRKPQPPSNADNPEQSRRFIEAARAVEADETPGALDRAFDKIVKPKSDANKDQSPKKG